MIYRWEQPGSPHFTLQNPGLCPFLKTIPFFPVFSKTHGSLFILLSLFTYVCFVWATGSPEDIINATGEYVWLFQCRKSMVHSILFVFLWLLLTSIPYKHLWDGNVGPGCEGDTSDAAVERVQGWWLRCTGQRSTSIHPSSGHEVCILASG